MPPTRPTGEATAPATPNRPARLNRTLLTVFGLIAVLGGAYIVLRGTGALATGTVAAFGLPVQDPQASLLPAGLRLPTWATYVAIVAAVIIGLLCLRWLLAQTRRRASSATWWFPAERDAGDAARAGGGREAGETRMDTSAATDALAAELESYSGVHSASAVITGDRAHPELHIRLGVTDQAPVGEIRERIDSHALSRLRQALELDALPTEILVRLGASSNTSRTH